MTVKYTNRDGDNLSIDFPRKGLALITGYKPGVRMGADREGSSKIMFIDPSGGPFIFLGGDLNDILLSHKHFLEADHKKIITRLAMTLEGIEVEYEEKSIKSKK